MEVLSQEPLSGHSDKVVLGQKQELISISVDDNRGYITRSLPLYYSIVT